MNELESQVEVAGDGTSLREQLKVLRTLLAVCLVMLIGLAVGADYVLSKQIQIVRDQSRQLDAVADSFPQAAANDFVSKLGEYVKTHADFKSVTVKYPGIFNSMPASAPAK